MDAVVFAPLGPNPAPLVELVHALTLERGLRVRAAFVVVTEEGKFYLDHELLPTGGPLDELHHFLGPDSLARTGVHARVVTRAGGAPIDDDLDPADAELYRTAVWETARAAIAEARDAPVVFALAGGRRRTATAMSVALFQLLARPQDLCVDVRVSDPSVEGGTGFFFPEQAQRAIHVAHGRVVDARTVRIHLVDVALPRVRTLLRSADLTDYPTALAAGQRAITEAGAPTLRIDLSKGEIWARDVPVHLPPSAFAWYTCLALARVEPLDVRGQPLPAAHGWIGADERPSWARLAERTTGTAWRASLDPDTLLARILDDPSLVDRLDDDEEVALRASQSKTRALWKKRCTSPLDARSLVPEQRRVQQQSHRRLPLEPGLVTITGTSAPQRRRR
ncbi:CRISPR-associated ring nuclease [Myxococcota bacterium]|nr:CRISPR-associated ring nuclease [Myxococcota bacterium]